MSGLLSDLPFIDLYIRLDQDDTPLFRSNQRGQGHINQIVPDEYVASVKSLAEQAKASLGQEKECSFDFDGVRCRLAKQTMADGTVWVCVRRVNTQVPDLEKLGFAPHISMHMHQLGERDGLIIVCGAAGQGKTTTAAALLKDFLVSYGGLAIAIEDPVEYIMKGRHGTFGQCFQMEAKTDADWEGHLKSALRWAPRYVFVGEVRTPKAAEQLLRAATTGHTVITTVHASTPEEALMGLLFLAEQAMGAGGSNILAGCLTALLHQTMKESGPFVKYLFTEADSPGDPIRSLVREGKIGMMSTYIDRIAARLANQPLGLQMGSAPQGQPASGAMGGLPPLAGTLPPLTGTLPPLAGSLPPLPRGNNPLPKDGVK